MKKYICDVCGYIYDPEISTELKGYFLEDLKDSELITDDKWEHRSRISKIMEPIARLFGSLF